MKRRHPKVVVLSYDEACEWLEDCDGKEPLAIVSIGEPGTSPPSGFKGHKARLRLECHDTELEDLGPSAHDVWATVEFARQIAQHPGTVLVHCHAGVSRSAAAALTLFCVWFGPGGESAALAKVFKIRPQAHPNRLFVRHADRLLFLDGALVRAVEGWSR